MLGWILQPGEDSRTPLRLTAMARAGSLDLAAPAVQHTVGLMQQHHVALDTTASILEQLMLSRAGHVPPGQEDFLGHMPIGFQRYRKRSFVTLPDAAADAAYHSGFAKVLETIGMLHRAGIVLLPGTDEATGFAVQRELELYVKAGLTPAEALRADTLDAERFFGREAQLGTIARASLPIWCWCRAIRWKTLPRSAAPPGAARRGRLFPQRDLRCARHYPIHHAAAAPSRQGSPGQPGRRPHRPLRLWIRDCRPCRLIA
jgi:hypothetical protein